MWVPSGHLVADSVDHVVHRELAGLGPELSVEDDLKQQVAELLHEMVPRALVDGLHDLVGLFDDVRAKGSPGLLAIPRAATFGPEASHEGEEGDEASAGGVSHGTIVESHRHYTQAA
jgi:hypothetical protein